MGRRVRVVAATVCAAGVVALPVGGASASCAGPALKVDAGLRAGVTTTVRGTRFVDGCDDTSGSSSVLGCTASRTTSEQVPLSGVDLTLVQGERRWDLGRADATGRTGSVTWTVTLPQDVAVGQARLEAGDTTLTVTLG